MPETRWRTLPSMYQILTLEFALINRPCRSIKDEVKSVGYKQDRGVGIRIVEANGDSGDILQRYRRIESLFRHLQVGTQLPVFCTAV
jgi:hypothetical protein